MLTTTTPSVTPAPHAVWDAAIRASGQGEKQTNPSSHHHCIVPLRTGEYLNLPPRGYFHRMGERKRGEKPDCRAWVTSLFGGCPFDHWLEFEVKEAPRRRPPRLGSPSQGLGTLKPTSVPLPGTQPRCRDAVYRALWLHYPLAHLCLPGDGREHPSNSPLLQATPNAYARAHCPIVLFFSSTEGGYDGHTEPPPATYPLIWPLGSEDTTGRQKAWVMSSPAHFCSGIGPRLSRAEERKMAPGQVRYPTTTGRVKRSRAVPQPKLICSARVVSVWYC